jgi:hypothetical protein
MAFAAWPGNLQPFIWLNDDHIRSWCGSSQTFRHGLLSAAVCDVKKFDLAFQNGQVRLSAAVRSTHTAKQFYEVSIEVSAQDIIRGRCACVGRYGRCGLKKKPILGLVFFFF